MSDFPDHRAPSSSPDDFAIAEEAGVRVFWINASTQQDLVDRLALLISERMDDADELHVTYNAMQTGWQEHPAQKGHVLRAPKPARTELFFEYSACVILRRRDSSSLPQS